jgi:hypothetical protein
VSAKSNRNFARTHDTERDLMVEPDLATAPELMTTPNLTRPSS